MKNINNRDLLNKMVTMQGKWQNMSEVLLKWCAIEHLADIEEPQIRSFDNIFNLLDHVQMNFNKIEKISLIGYEFKNGNWMPLDSIVYEEIDPLNL